MPLGGYRSYRPLIIRYDLVSPINFLLILLVCYTTCLAIKYIHKKWYYATVLLILSIFWVKDKPKFHDNKCEKQQLRLIASTNQDTVYLNKDCVLLLWDGGTSFYETRHNTKMLYNWKISKKPIYYFHQ